MVIGLFWSLVSDGLVGADDKNWLHMRDAYQAGEVNGGAVVEGTSLVLLVDSCYYCYLDQDPKLMAAFKDPEIMAALQDGLELASWVVCTSSFLF
ncbi:hypothetical protein U1Q18_047900 [Sarracenia purpurea var. burkii]